MSRPYFTDEFKIDAVKQLTERGYFVAEVSNRLGASAHSLYQWRKRFLKPPLVTQETAGKMTENSGSFSKYNYRIVTAFTPYNHVCLLRNTNNKSGW